jgi:uncharacterized protein
MRLPAAVGLLALLLLAVPVLAQDQTPAPAPPRDWLASGLDVTPTPAPAEQAGCQAGAPYAEMQVEGQPRLSLELARTPQEHQTGLMYRESLDPDSGMLFVYDRPATEGYWMHNTLIPLSIAWLDKDGTIVDVQDMQPQTDDTHDPAAPYWYALEVNQGWFQAHGVGVGQVVRLCLGS